MSSILTNTGSMVALQTLRTINSNLNSTQNAVSTGKDINSAKDNAAIWSIAKVMEADTAGIDSVKESLDLGTTSVSIASTAAETMVSELQKAQDMVIKAQAENVPMSTLNDQLTTIKENIVRAMNSAQFNGLNFLNSSGTDPVGVLAAMNRAPDGTVTMETIDVDRTAVVDASGAFVGDFADLEAMELTDATTAETALEDITVLLGAATDLAAYYGGKEAQLTAQSEFMGKLSDAMTAGVGTLVDADMEEASARLSALQTQQQLGIQALSIANSQPQTLLKLFS